MLGQSLGEVMQVSSIILINLSSPRTICQVRRNSVPIAKHDHVLWVPSSFSKLDVFQQDRTVVQEMSCFVAHETAVACSPWMRIVHPLGAGDHGYGPRICIQVAQKIVENKRSDFESVVYMSGLVFQVPHLNLTSD